MGPKGIKRPFTHVKFTPLKFLFNITCAFPVGPVGFQHGKAVLDQEMAPVSLEFLILSRTKSVFKIIPTRLSTGLKPQINFNSKVLCLALKINYNFNGNAGWVFRIILTNTGIIKTSGPIAFL